MQKTLPATPKQCVSVHVTLCIPGHPQCSCLWLQAVLDVENWCGVLQEVGLPFTDGDPLKFLRAAQQFANERYVHMQCPCPGVLPYLQAPCHVLPSKISCCVHSFPLHFSERVQRLREQGLPVLSKNEDATTTLEQVHVHGINLVKLSNDDFETLL